MVLTQRTSSREKIGEEYPFPFCYDANQTKGYCFVVTRKTPKTCWQDRYSDLEKAKERFYEFLFSSNKKLEEKVRNGK